MSSNINTAQIPVDNSFMLKSAVEQDNLVANEKLTTRLEKQTIKPEDNAPVSLQNKQSAQIIAEEINKEDASEAAKLSAQKEEEVEEALEVVSSFINSTIKQVTFSHDKNAGKMVITMLDKETQEVINQFPSEKIISMAGRIKELYQEVESISGLIIDSHV